MRFKSEALREEFKRLHPAVQIMAFHFEGVSITQFGIEPVVTRIFEEIKGSTNTHPDGRAIDFRDEHEGKNLYTAEQRKTLIKSMNERFPGEDDYATCVYHSFSGGPFHFHIQASLGDLALYAQRNTDVHMVI